MRRCINLFAAVLAAVLTFSAEAASDRAPKYVFVFIGDGMSVPQRMNSETFAKADGLGELAMNHFPVRVETATRSANAVITDSAAAATAIACGEKTNNGMLGVATNGEKLVSSAEMAKRAGRRVGIVTTVTIVHATPAGFYAHRRTRGDTRRIAMDLVNSGFDYFAGGGIGNWKKPDGGYFDTNGNFITQQPDEAEIPGAHPFDIWKAKGGVFVRNDLAAFEALRGGKPAWCVFGDGGMDFAIDRSPSQPTLRALVEKGIELLDNPQGFFLMCEGGRIDYACHANDSGTSLRDVMALDDAVKAAVAFRERHPDETLIITTGDHETGGLIAGPTGAGARFDLKLLRKQKMSAAAFGELLVKRIKATSGQLSEDEFLAMVENDFGLGAVTDAERRQLLKAFAADLKKKSSSAAQEAKRLLGSRAGIVWKSGGHTALPTLTTAVGPCADEFRSVHDNTGIGRKLKEIYSR